MGPSVYEYRTDFGQEYRIYFGKECDRLVLLLAGGTKRRQKVDIQAGAEKYPSFRKGLLQEGVECLLAGDVDTGNPVLRDYINATRWFEELS